MAATVRNRMVIMLILKFLPIVLLEYTVVFKSTLCIYMGCYTNNGTHNGNQSSITNNNSNAGNYGLLLLLIVQLHQQTILLAVPIITY